MIEPALIHIQHVQRKVSDLPGDLTLAAHLSEVTNPAQQTIGDARRAARATGDFKRALGFGWQPEDSGRPPDDRGQILGGVELQTLDDTEAVA